MLVRITSGDRTGKTGELASRRAGSCGALFSNRPPSRLAGSLVTRRDEDHDEIRNRNGNRENDTEKMEGERPLCAKS